MKPALELPGGEMQKFRLDGVEYGAAEAYQSRANLIALRDEALKQNEFGWAVYLSHAIALFAMMGEYIWPEHWPYVDMNDPLPVKDDLLSWIAPADTLVALLALRKATERDIKRLTGVDDPALAVPATGEFTRGLRPISDQGGTVHGMNCPPDCACRK